MTTTSPVIDIVSQSGVSPFSYDIANSNSTPNPISPLGKKTDPTKKFKYRFSEDLPAEQLYRFQLAPEKNKKTPMQFIKQQVLENSGTNQYNDIEIDQISIDRTLITTPSSLNTNFSSKTKKIVRKSINELENTHQNTSMPPSFHLEPEERLIKQRMPFLVLHGNPLQKYVIDYDEKVQSQRLNIPEKHCETQREIDSDNKSYFEEVPRVSYNDFVKLQNQIIDLQQQQRTKHFLPDHVPQYMRRKAQQSFSLSRPMTQAALTKNSEISSNNNSIIQRNYQATSLAKSSPSPFRRPLEIPELNMNSKTGKNKLNERRRAQTTVNGSRVREYNYIINADFNEDDEEMQNRINSHNELVKSFTKMIENNNPISVKPLRSKKPRYSIPSTPFNSGRTQKQGQ